MDLLRNVPIPGTRKGGREGMAVRIEGVRARREAAAERRNEAKEEDMKSIERGKSERKA